MPDFREKISRRDVLGGIVMLPALAGALISTTTVAEAKMAPTAANYQTHPKGKQQCSGCRYFHPGHTATTGSCDIVAGSISAKGWCRFFAAK